jgi:hypothetical protein
VKVSVFKGDVPPPGPLAKLTPMIARVLVRDLLSKRELVSTPDECIACGVPFLETKTYGISLYETKNLKLSRSQLTFDVDQLTQANRTTLSTLLDFAVSDYIYSGNGFVWAGGKGSRVPNISIFKWTDPADGERFTQAVNLLIYEAHKSTATPDDLASFETIAKNWRENPASRPKPNDEMTRNRVLAEQAINEKDLVRALMHYEQGLEAFPTWPEGWFNAAFLYGELGEYEGAASRMRRYLALMPEAPDAAAAREKIIIWDDKAKRGQ